MAEPDKGGQPLMKPQTVRLFAGLALVVMAVALIADFIAGHGAHFDFDGFVGFYALFGLASGFVIIGVAKGLGVFLTRPDAYYGEDPEADE